MLSSLWLRSECQSVEGDLPYYSRPWKARPSEDRLAVSQAQLEDEYLIPLSPGIGHTDYSQISRLEISLSEVLHAAHQVPVE